MDTHYRISMTVNDAPLLGDMSVLFSGEGEPVGGHFIGPAVHDYYLIHVVLDGEGEFETLGETFRLGAGDAFVIYPDLLVRYEADHARPWTYMWIGFSGDLAEDALRGMGITPDRAVVRGCPLRRLRRRFRSLRESLENGATAAIGNIEASGLLRLILSELAKTQRAGGDVWERTGTDGMRQAPGQNARADDSVDEQGTGADSTFPGRMQSGQLQANSPASEAPANALAYRRINQAILLISLQYSMPLSVGVIARTVGYHRAHLTKLFKEATGLPPMQYLFKVRMKKAERLLAGELTIAQIAASVGYNDPLFFTKQFRKWSGASPSEFRKRLKARQHV